MAKETEKSLCRKTKTDLLQIIFRKDSIEVKNNDEIKSLKNVIKSLENELEIANSINNDNKLYSQKLIRNLYKWKMYTFIAISIIVILCIVIFILT